MTTSETEVTGTDPYGNEMYKALYEEIMFDVGKLASIERSVLVLKPDVPMFIISVKMKAQQAAKTIGDIASTRAERKTVYISIVDETYAPGTLTALWKRYGRERVKQEDRLNIEVAGVEESAEVDVIPVESTEQPIQEVIGALWRVMPEGIRNREVISGDNVITAVATEEIMRPEMLKEAQELHDRMVEEAEHV